MESEDSSMAAITKRFAELEADKGMLSRGKKVDPSNKILPNTHIYAALIILVLGVSLRKSRRSS